MKLYSGPLSLFTAKVRIALAEKRLAYDRVEVGWSMADRYLPHHPDVVALNPNREVPVLVDGDVVVYDSTVILEYLEDRHPEPPLYPREPAPRARCRQLEAAADELIFPHVWDVIEEAMYPASAGGRDETRLANARAGLDAQHASLDAQLSDDAFLCGDFSVADIGTFIFVAAAASLGAPVGPGYAQLAGWLARVGQRPSVAEEMQAMTRFLGETRAASA